jgi:large subunit ribosomal protein L21
MYMLPIMARLDRGGKKRMYAIIETGGKQYRVTEGDQITVEKLSTADGEKVVFDKVLVLGEGAEAKIGTPYVDAATVFGKVVTNGKSKKVVIFKYKAKKDYRKKQGHRQPFTLVEITGISADSKEPQAETVPAKTETEQAEQPSTAKKPALKSMKKAELIAFAKESNIEIDEKATNAAMIEAIESALQ